MQTRKNILIKNMGIKYKNFKVSVRDYIAQNLTKYAANNDRNLTVFFAFSLSTLAGSLCNWYSTVLDIALN